MALIDISLVKKHLRIYHSDEDTEIAVYQAAAEVIITEYIDREVVASGTPATADGIVITPPITAAILLMVGDLFENREPDNETGNAVLPRAVRALLAPYRVWRTFVESEGC